MKILAIVWSNGHANMSDMMCCDYFVGSQMSHSCSIHFWVCDRVCIVSHDMIECGMMWKRILLHLHGVHIHTELMFALSHGFT